MGAAVFWVLVDVTPSVVPVVSDPLESESAADDVTAECTLLGLIAIEIQNDKYIRVAS